MKIVIAMDSFKGSMTSMEAGNAAGEGVLRVFPDAKVIVKPLADGGEGTMEALSEGLGGNIISVQVSDPLGRRIAADFAEVVSKNGEKTAVIEMAKAAGLTLLAAEERNPYKTTTYGVGEMICDAMDRGCRSFLIGIGGSSTNDGGLGMLRALGYRFTDGEGREITAAENLGKIKQIHADDSKKELKDCSFYIACDVTNPLCGERGATYIYAPQKGLAEDNLADMDAAMNSYADAVACYAGEDNRNVPGAGAAGGMGFAFVSMLHGKLLPGAELVMQMTGLEESLKDADFFFTGEGRIDVQTAMGKAPMTAAQAVKRMNSECKVYAFGGKKEIEAEGTVFDGIYQITPEEMSLSQAMERCNAMENMRVAVSKRMEEMKI